jgi:hypothetical protein
MTKIITVYQKSNNFPYAQCCGFQISQPFKKCDISWGQERVVLQQYASRNTNISE